MNLSCFYGDRIINKKDDNMIDPFFLIPTRTPNAVWIFGMVMEQEFSCVRWKQRWDGGIGGGLSSPPSLMIGLAIPCTTSPQIIRYLR